MSAQDNGPLSDPAADFWLAVTDDNFIKMDERPVCFQPTKSMQTCIICLEWFTLDKLCDVHIKCAAMCCRECLVRYMSSSLNYYSATPFPPTLPCACKPEDGGSDLLLPHLKCPAARFLGRFIMKRYADAHRNRYTNEHRLGLTEEQKRQMGQDIAQAVGEIAPLAEAQGWKQCPWCGQFVERNQGCLSVLCLCGQRFCYECGGKLLPDHDCPCQEYPHGSTEQAEEAAE